jgi:hypothetical protein
MPRIPCDAICPDQKYDCRNQIEYDLCDANELLSGIVAVGVGYGKVLVGV